LKLLKYQEKVIFVVENWLYYFFSSFFFRCSRRAAARCLRI